MRKENIPRLVDYRGIKEDHIAFLVYENLIKDLEYAINKYAKGNLLYIGCGNKPYESAFVNKITEYIGCDIVQSSQIKVDNICDETNIPISDNSIDTIFSTQTVEHTANHQGMINEANRPLKHGGYLILSGPMYWPWNEVPHDYFRFTKHGFEYILKNAGFGIEKTISNGGMWAVAGQSYIHALTNSKSNLLIPRIWRFLFFRLRLMQIHNMFFSWLDKKGFNSTNTMNYVIIAIKK